MREEIQIGFVPDRIINKFDDPDGYVCFNDETRTISDGDKEIKMTDKEYYNVITHILSNEW